MENAPLTDIDEADEHESASGKKSRKRKAEAVGTRSLSAAQRAPERRLAPEANQLHGSKRRQEQIGHMLVAAETPSAVRQSKSEVVPKTLSKQQVETMNRAELLSLSEQIVIGGSSLRQIYESHLVGEHALRRLVAEYISGGDLKKALRQEIVEREIDFERDPALRDKPHHTAAPLTGTGTVALNKLLEQAAANLPAGHEETAFLKARAQYEATQQAQQQKQRRLIDITLTAAIIILISAVIIFYIRSI